MNSYITEKHIRAARMLEQDWISAINFLKNYKAEPGLKFAVVFRKEGRQSLKEYIFRNVKCIENQDLQDTSTFSFNNSDLVLLDIEILDVVQVISKKRE